MSEVYSFSLFFFVAIVALVTILSLVIGHRQKDKLLLFCSYLFIISLITLVLAIKFNFIAFDWRHFYYLLPLTTFNTVYLAKKLEIHPLLRVATFLIIFGPGFLNFEFILKNQEGLKFLRLKSAQISSDKRVLNILFSKEDPRITRITSYYVEDLYNGTFIPITIPYHPQALEALKNLSKLYQYVRIIYNDDSSSEENITALQVLSALSSDYRVESIDYVREKVSSHLLLPGQLYVIKKVLFKKKVL